MTAPDDVGERSALLAALDQQRAHVLGIVEGLSEADLRRAVLPSGWSCLGLVRHLALDDERFWFRAVVAAEPDVVAGFQASDADGWEVPHGLTVEAVLEQYRDECRRASGVIAATNLSAEPAWWPQDQFGDWRLRSVREVLLHVITETACHAGHLDAARELIDGHQWLRL